MATVDAVLCFPHLPNSSCIRPNRLEIGLVDILIFLLSAATSALNLLVIISVSHFRQLHSSTNLILLSLAISDFLTGLVAIPVFSNIWKFCWYFDQLLCGAIYIVPTTAIMASVETVVLISVDRYIAICDPLRYPTRMTEKTVGISISICWFLAFLYALSICVDGVLHVDKYRNCHGECTIYGPREANIVWAFVIPVSIIVILYTKVFATAVSQARGLRLNVTNVKSNTSRKSEIKAARNLGVVVLIFLMCHFTFYFAQYSQIKIVIFGVSFHRISIYLYFINSCVNPLIYALLYPWFRKAIKVIVTLQILRQGSADFKIQ